ncbi:hypothetical protein [Brevundimonas sp.]|uniref:hypothetical protein n=1 Tax=Brevundimonas sp. TaxID=1871086 RepID=UPI002FCB1D58
MLEAPAEDPHRLSLDQAIAKAVLERQAAGARIRPDADALALRQVLKDLHPTQRSAVRAVLGRMEAGLGRAVMACGGVSQLLAADRWGPFARPLAEPEQAIEAARSGARVLVDIGTRPWWAKLLATPDVRVIAALPDDARARPRSLIISNETSGPTGDDRTFWITDSPMAEAAIIQSLSNNGLAAEALAQSGALKLFALSGYVQAEDGRLQGAPGQLSGIIGAAPIF